MLDFHKLTAVSLKYQVLKAPVKHKDLKLKLDSLEELNYSLFENIFIDVLSTHAPIKTKTLRTNSHQNL